jgi:hypothetical protein
VAPRRQCIMICSVCACDFDLKQEGGIAGEFGILPVAFCPTCYSCMDAMISRTCEWCIERDGDGDEGA